MALITCPECGREVSDKAAACPYCGNPLKENPETEMSTKADAVSAAQKKNYLKYSLLLWPLYVVEIIVFIFVQFALGLDGKIGEIVSLGILGLITAVNFVLAIPLIRGMVKDNYLKTQSNKIFPTAACLRRERRGVAVCSCSCNRYAVELVAGDEDIAQIVF